MLSFGLLGALPTTGSDALDAVIVIVASALGLSGSTKLGIWLKRIIDVYRMIASFDSRLKQCEEVYDVLRKRQSDHEEKDAIQAMTYMGFVEVGEEACLVVDEKGKTVMISPALARLMGLSLDEAVNGAWKDVIHVDDRTETLKKWDAFVTGALLHLTLRFRFQKPSGTVVPVIVKAVRKRMVQGGVVRIVGLVWRQEDAPPTPEPTKS